MLRRLGVAAVALLFLVELSAESGNEFFPIIKNYKRSEYDAGAQIWVISQAANDLMYFGNNYGLLEFDGHNWERYGVENYTVSRSVLAAEDGKIYVGLSNSFGYYMTDSTGRQNFYSLLHLLPPEKRKVEEIWRIHQTPEGVVFQSFQKLYILKGNEIQVYDAPKEFYLSFFIHNKLYLVDWELGVVEFNNGKFKTLVGFDQLPQSEICAILPYGKDLMIVTTGKGIFILKDGILKKWETPSLSYLTENQVYCAIRIDEDRIAFGTIQKGLLICNNEGVPITIVDKASGLQNNTILSMYLDKSGNLWLGTNNGIDLLYINSPISQLEFNHDYGSGYTSLEHKGKLYIGTNQGLYYRNAESYASDNRFRLVERLKGQVWSLKVIDDKLFCGHNKGTYVVDGNAVEKLGEEHGAWIYLHSKKHPNRIIGGAYSGLTLFEKVNGKWQFIRKIADFNESARMMFFDEDESIWISHGFKGVYHLTLNETYDRVVSEKFYNSQNGFVTDYGINVAYLQGQIVFLSSHGAFKYDERIDSMVPSKYFNDFFMNNHTNYALEDIYGNIWYYGQYTLGAKLIKNDGTYRDVSMPFKQLQGSFIEGFQHVYPIDNSNFLISNENGFVNYNPNKPEYNNQLFNLYLNKVTLTKSDSVIFKGHEFDSNENNIPKIDFKNNSIHFYFSAVHYETPYRVEFATYLEGYDTDWSGWEERYSREFTNLKEGEYVFHIKARNIHNVETQPLVYKLEILPPWKRTKKAYALYTLIVFLIGTLVFVFIKRRIAYMKLREKKMQRQKYIEKEKELQKEALIAEKEIIRLRNEQLRDKLKTKNKELANSTMDTIKRNKFLISLKKDMQKNNSDIINDVAKRQNNRLVRKIDNEINNEKDWKVFETHFNNVHEEFLAKVKKQYPQISPAELRLCACLRMNISSKEIASLLNISIRGVEASRYRLRKALELDRQTNLTDFILSL